MLLDHPLPCLALRALAMHGHWWSSVGTGRTYCDSDPAISLEAHGSNVESYDLQIQVLTWPLWYYVFDSRGTNLCDKSQRLTMHT